MCHLTTSGFRVRAPTFLRPMTSQSPHSATYYQGFPRAQTSSKRYSAKRKPARSADVLVQAVHHPEGLSAPMPPGRLCIALQIEEMLRSSSNGGPPIFPSTIASTRLRSPVHGTRAPAVGVQGHKCRDEDSGVNVRSQNDDVVLQLRRAGGTQEWCV